MFLATSRVKALKKARLPGYYDFNRFVLLLPVGQNDPAVSPSSSHAIPQPTLSGVKLERFANISPAVQVSARRRAGVNCSAVGSSLAASIHSATPDFGSHR